MEYIDHLGGVGYLAVGLHALSLRREDVLGSFVMVKCFVCLQCTVELLGAKTQQLGEISLKNSGITAEIW